MISAFLPCRLGSERVKYKNTRPFGGEKESLIGIKLKQLLAVAEIDNIVVSSDDPLVLDRAAQFSENRVLIDERPKELCLSTTATDDVVKYLPTLIGEGDVLWTHVTSPMINSTDYSSIIKAFQENISRGYDSLATVTKIQKFLWDKDGPINYDRAAVKWPSTQDLAPIYEINSGAFLASVEIYKKLSDRIGTNPFLFEMDSVRAVDIDTWDDFLFAEKLYLSEAKD